jgi:heterodisulfide reductase subunit C
MATILQQLIFVLLFAFSVRFFSRHIRNIIDIIREGKPENRSDKPQERLKNMLLLAFGQKKMFRNWLPAVLHFFIYAAFVITQIELLEIIIDGTTGIHRFFWNIVPLGGLYTFIISFIEILSVLALVATIAFLSRRNLLKVPRFWSREMTAKPRNDANLILLGELTLIIGIFTMNTADMTLHHGEYGFAISQFLMPLFANFSESTLHFLERFGWWLHLLTVLGFMCYLPYSKHLHILFAFPNAYFANLDSTKGRMTPMPRIEQEIRLMLGQPVENPDEQPVKFGAKDVQDLSWKSLLDAWSCTECGRCTAACPAAQTGKLLSPRKIMMDTRDRMEDQIKFRQQNGKDAQDNKSLLNDYISVEELRACTTCNACVEECPVSINPLDIILELRRHLILEDSNSAEEWNLMFNNIETNGAVWKMPATDRANWTSEV